MSALAIAGAQSGSGPDNSGRLSAAPPVAGALTTAKTAGLQEIVVTAQKRSENLQRVPVSVTALTTDKLKSEGISGTADIAAAIPGVTFNRELFSITPSIRGLAQTAPTAGDESATAIYVDGVYMSSLGSGFLSFNNISQIEVLKGPQGTLFGRNAAAGVINITTRTPQEKFGLEASAGYGNYNTVDGNLYVTTGLAPGIAMDFAVYGRDQMDGWGKDIATGKDIYKGREIDLRSKILANIGDLTTFTLAGDYSSSKDQQGVALRLLPGAVGLDTALGFPTSVYPGFYNTNSDLSSYAKRDDWGVSGTLKHDFGALRLVSISAYRGADKRVLSDTDATPVSILNAGLRIPLKQFTQEVQLLAPSTNRIQWIVGAFFMSKREGYEPVTLTGLLAPPDYQGDAYQQTRSLAGFAQATAPLGNNTDLTLGLRYTSDRQELVGSTYIGSALAEGPVDRAKTFNKLTYKAAIDHKFTRDIMAYASYSRGFKGGVFDVSTILAAPVKPEVVDAYEIGLKTELLDHHLRFNLAGFWQNVSNLQLLRVIDAQGFLFNAAKSRSRGVEIEATAIPVHNFSISGSLSYIDAIYTDFPDAPYYIPNPEGGDTVVTIPNAKGNRVSRTPKWATNFSISYKMETSIGDIDFSINRAFVGRQYWEADDRVSQRPYNMINSSILWNAPNGHWNARIWARNLLNEKIYNYMLEQSPGDVGSPAPPRTYGVSIGVKI